MREQDGQRGPKLQRKPADDPIDPVRNPEPIPPASDPEYPAITGPEEIPPGVEPVGTNPEEVFIEGDGPSSRGTEWKGRVPLRRRPGGSVREP
ncbi:MAG: hypothetical protein AB7O95_12600 [Geminicoccaceae bacterium]